MKKIYQILLLLFSIIIFATPNYVYHEQTTNNPGCGSYNYMSTTSPSYSTALTIAWKIEYQNWWNQTRIYYTTDGSNPSASKGVTSGTTQMITGNWSCLFNSNVDVAYGTFPTFPTGTIVKYIIGAWHSGGGDEVFANGNSSNISSANATVFTFTIPEVTTTWDGSSWDNGVPNVNVNAVINDVYSGASFECKNLTVNSDLDINGVVNVNGIVENYTNITVNEGGNFVQKFGSTYTLGLGGNLIIHKDTASVADKYVFWSSPVTGADVNFLNLYPLINGFPPYVMTYNSNTDYYDEISNDTNMAPGIGYSVKVPLASTTINLSGEPNNGNVTVALDNSANSNGNTYNLIGNPYPSNILLTDFYADNSANIASTLYFWDNTSNSIITQTGAQASPVGFAIFNASGSGTWTAAGNGVTPVGKVARIGQGFIVKAIGSSVTFNNSNRTTDTGTFFNKNTATTDGKYWLKLTTPYNAYNTLAVTYGEGAQNTFDAFDSNVKGIASDAFYSVLGTEKLAIQGRADFVDSDVVILGDKRFEAGLHTISLVDKSGVFASGQAIYLKDTLLGTYTNLQTGNYTFVATAGTTENRFEIVYKTSNVLATNDAAKNELQLYKDQANWIVKSPQKIENIDIYDASGRIIKKLRPNTKKADVIINNKGVYLLNITTGNQIITKKLIQ